MKVIAKTEKIGLSTVYLAQSSRGKYIEFAESLTPPYTKDEKWVLLVSTMSGCPISCKFCDASVKYKGKLSTFEIFEQIDFMVYKSYSNGIIPSKKFKIQFARMGEPALNYAVLEVLETLPFKFYATGLLPSVSTIAPSTYSTIKFFQQLKEIKDKLYKGNFQLQFSIHSTNKAQRDWLIPVKKWSFEQISEYGKWFYSKGDKKIALNFAVNSQSIVEPDIIMKYFPPDIYILKITPINPTIKSLENSIETYSIPSKVNCQFIEILESAGYQVIISIGELEENKIGSNCGQLILKYLNSNAKMDNSYTYRIKSIS